jgi:hypothetical protein
MMRLCGRMKFVDSLGCCIDRGHKPEGYICSI